jgi:lipopolysaccharide/colanic/teichoic acid biosynthesis glycosyltransferase
VLLHNQSLFRFLKENLDLATYDYPEWLTFNVDANPLLHSIEPSSLRLLICLNNVNDIRRINRFFLEAHKRLKPSGTLAGVLDSIELVKKRIFQKYPRYMATFLYLIHFSVYRAWPRMPVIKHLHFILLRGKNPPFSKAELLGRLSFCGFKIVKIELINGRLYFIAQRIAHPSSDSNPSFGPVITLKRIGYRGRPIYIKKLRTMHPYSEYIQDYVLEQNRLQTNGKIKDDFRITEWGRWFRKHWVDELPQVVNWVRGDITLMGVRAISEHYLNLYPPDLRELRIRFKPGLIPPYYADLPKSFDEILESERRYLQKKVLHPLHTDISYFFKAVINIVFKRARSR